MQKAYTFILNKIWKVTGKIDKRVRDVILFFCCAGLMWIYYFSSRDVLSARTQIYGTGIIVVMIIFSINGVLSPVNWERLLYFPLMLFGAGIILISLIHDVGEGYITYAIGLIIIFPALYFVWINRGDFGTLYMILSLAVFLLGAASFAYCFYLARTGELHILGDRVAGLRANPNTFGRLGVINIMAGTYLTLTYRNNRALAALFSVGTGIGLSYIALSASRTSMLCAMVCILTMVLILIKARIAENNKPSLNWPMILCVVTVAVAAFIGGLQMDNVYYRHSDVAGDEEAQEGIDETGVISGRLNTNSDANTYSSGRIEIWEIYLRNASLLGNDFAEIEEELQEQPSIWAHNNIVDYMFKCGYVVAAIYTFFYIGQGIKGLGVLFSKERSKEGDFFLVSAIGIYSVLAMLDIATLPFSGCIPCIYFLSIAPIMGKQLNR